MTDEYALNVTYIRPRRAARAREEGRALRAGRAGRRLRRLQPCVVVCPTGIDIRDGPQLDCINCGLCIDACDDVMAKIGRPTRPDRLRHRHQREAPRSRQAASCKTRILRPRTIALRRRDRRRRLAMAVALATRNSSASRASTTATRCSCACSDGSIRNAYTVRSSTRFPRRARSKCGSRVAEPSQRRRRRERGANGWPVLAVGPDQTLEARVFLTLPRDGASRGREPAPKDRRDIVFALVDLKRRQRAGEGPLHAARWRREMTVARAPASRSRASMCWPSARILRNRLRRELLHGARRHHDLQRPRGRQALSGRPALRRRDQSPRREQAKRGWKVDASRARARRGRAGRSHAEGCRRRS